MSGNDINEEHPQNIIDILHTLFIFHFDIDIREEHLLKIYSIIVTLLVFHFDISGKNVNKEQL